jgi:hypothetical protein
MPPVLVTLTAAKKKPSEVTLTVHVLRSSHDWPAALRSCATEKLKLV